MEFFRRRAWWRVKGRSGRTRFFSGKLQARLRWTFGLQKQKLASRGKTHGVLKCLKPPSCLLEIRKKVLSWPQDLPASTCGMSIRRRKASWRSRMMDLSSPSQMLDQMWRQMTTQGTLQGVDRTIQSWSGCIRLVVLFFKISFGWSKLTNILMYIYIYIFFFSPEGVQSTS